MYLLTIGEQLKIALYSCGFGFVLGLLFDFSELVLGLLPKKKTAVIIRDVAYMVSVTFLMHLFSLAVDNGEFKFYIYAMAALGWGIFYFTLNRFTRRLRERLTSVILTVFKRLKSVILKLSSKCKEKRRKKAEKNEKSLNLLLKDSEEVLYNKENSEFKGKGSGNEDEKIF